MTTLSHATQPEALSRPADLGERFTNFGASGVLLYALVTAVLLAWLVRRRELQAPAS